MSRTLAVDLVDTLVCRGDSEFLDAAVGILAEYEIPIGIEEFRSGFRKRYLEYSLGNYSGDAEFMSAVLGAAYRASEPQIERALISARIAAYRPIDGAGRFLESVAEKYRIVLCSNFVDEWAREILDRESWSAYFSNLVVSSTVRYRKPALGFFDGLWRIAGVQRVQDLVVIGDSIDNDYLGARRAGIECLLVGERRSSGLPEVDVPVFQSLQDVVTELAPSTSNGH